MIVNHLYVYIFIILLDNREEAETMMDSLIETGKLREKRKSGDFGDSSDEEVKYKVLLWNVYINWDKMNQNFEKVKTD